MSPENRSHSGGRPTSAHENMWLRKGAYCRVRDEAHPHDFQDARTIHIEIILRTAFPCFCCGCGRLRSSSGIRIER